MSLEFMRSLVCHLQFGAVESSYFCASFFVPPYLGFPDTRLNGAWPVNQKVHKKIVSWWI